MQSISTIGLDIAKSVFQVHGVEAAVRLGILPDAAAMPGGDRGVRLIAPLVPRVAGLGTYGAIDASGLCEALRQRDPCAARRPGRRNGPRRKGANRPKKFRPR